MTPWESAKRCIGFACIVVLLYSAIVGIFVGYEWRIFVAGGGVFLLGFALNIFFIGNMQRMHLDTVHMLCADLSKETPNLSLQCRWARGGDCRLELCATVWE